MGGRTTVQLSCYPGQWRSGEATCLNITDFTAIAHAVFEKGALLYRADAQFCLDCLFCSGRRLSMSYVQCLGRLRGFAEGPKVATSEQHGGVYSSVWRLEFEGC